MSRLQYVTLAVIFFSSHCIVGAQKPEMLLCVQEDSAGVTGKKLVYGYIYGIKTECMPENEFLELYAKKMADIEKAIGLDTISNPDAVRLIQNGEKNFSGAKCKGFDFMNISFKSVNLTQADFESADLRNTSFQNANCSKTNFSNAFIKNANFRDANLTDANFKGAYISNAAFVGARGLYPEMFKSASTLYKTKFNKQFADTLKNRYPDLFKKPGKCWETNTWVGDSTDCDETSKNYKFKKIK